MWTASVVCFVAAAIASNSLFYVAKSDRGAPLNQVSFIFGDSLVEPGNNRYTVSLSRADFPPYGVDFAPSGFRPTGRFTNGRTLSDIIGQELGQKGLPPPYLAPTTHGKALLNGVNYASGAGGILDSTGQVFIARLSFNRQLQSFNNTKHELFDMFGEEATARFISKSIFVVSIGSNDYLDNYLLPFSQARARYSPPEYENLLISQFHGQLRTLYTLGARKIIVGGIGPIGCIPYSLSNDGPVPEGQCITSTNNFALSFNRRLRDVIRQLNSNCPGATFVYINTYDVALEVIKNYRRYGFVNADTACCGSGGKNRGRISCLPTTTYCGPERSKYVFFDTYHPSEAANIIFAARFLDGGPDVAFPINIRRLAAL